MAKKEETDGDEKQAGPSMMKAVLIAAVLSTVLGGGMSAGTFFVVSGMHAEQLAAVMAAAGGEGAEGGVAPATPDVPPQYYSMDPKFVVSFSEQKKARFMQFSLEIMTRDGDVIKKIEEHMPAIRSSLLMLFGGQDYGEMVTREGKEKLLMGAMDDINTTLQKISGAAEKVEAVEAAYFNSFVIQ